MTNIGERLKEERLRAGFTQVSLAQAVGVAQSTQTAYETNRRTPDAKYLAALAEAGLDIGYVVSGKVADACMDPEERQVVALFRKLDLRGRRFIVGAMEIYLGGG
jgi:transcriptional regulator with XRE-family HTH domain